MRIISGARRGALLASPPGDGTRPLRDRIRESLFGILRRELPGRRVVDCFAGSGAVGLEALSNGASYAAFIEPDAAALKVISGNVNKLRYEDQAQVIAGYTPQAFAKLSGAAFDLLFLMPPYHSGLCLPALEAARGDRFAADAIAVCEVHSDEPFEVPSGWEETDRRDYGITRLVFLRRVVA